MGKKNLKRVLMIAFHYPPISGSSGLQRTLKFSKYLSEFGWSPTILTVNPMAYPATTDGQLRDVPEDIEVNRVWAFDAARHFAIRGAYPAILARPDRWISWWCFAVPVGLKLIREIRPHAIWSTYPIATAHKIGYTLSQKCNVPWVADFRDSMTEEDYPTDLSTRRCYQKIESRVVDHAKRVVFTTPGTLEMYEKRYAKLPNDRWTIVGNGYDEENFDSAKLSRSDTMKRDPRIVLVHSGVLYPADRNPIPFFKAIANLKNTNSVNDDNLSIVLRATGHDDQYAKDIAKYGIEKIVSLAPSIDYVEALQEMISADGLLLFQGPSCNHQIPAKLYEYIRAQRPVFALTDKNGDTAAEMNECGMHDVVDIDDVRSIERGVMKFLSDIRSGTISVPCFNDIERYSRRSRSKELAAILDSVSMNSVIKNSG